jgi:phosphoglycolate phosphatase-like HAD superfamily hydrolase
MSSSSSTKSSSITITMPKELKCVLWDVDGTMCDSFQLGFSSTRVVLQNNGVKDITEEDYHLGTKYVIYHLHSNNIIIIISRYTTPRRLAWHVTGNPDDPIGMKLFLS